MGLCTTYGVGQYASGYSRESHTAGWDRAYKASVGGRAMLWGHSAGASAPQSQEPWLPSDDTLVLFQALASVLGPIMSGDQNGQSWGNSTAQTMVSDAWSWVKSNYGAKSDACIVAGVSMGGALALNWARANPTLVKAILLFYPACNLGAIYNGTGAAANGASDLNAAYGGSWTTNGGNAYDPAQNASGYTGVPIYMGYSDADTVVGTANQTAFISAVGGTALTSRVYHNAGHADMTQVNVNDVVKWIDSYA